MAGQSGFIPGDIITQIDDVKVKSVSDWMKSLRESIESTHPQSYSISQDTQSKHDIPLSLSGRFLLLYICVVRGCNNRCG